MRDACLAFPDHVLTGITGSHEEKLVKQSKRLKGKSYRDQAMAQEDVKEEPKPKVGKAVPRNGKIMEVVVTKRPTKAASSPPSSPASSATEATTAAEEDSDVPRKIVRPQRIRKKLVLDLSDDEDVEMDDLPRAKAKAKAKATTKPAKAKRVANTDESSDFEPDNHSEESDAERQTDRSAVRQRLRLTRPVSSMKRGCVASLQPSNVPGTARSSSARTLAKIADQLMVCRRYCR